MPQGRLTNEKHERFAHLVVEGLSPGQAFKAIKAIKLKTAFNAGPIGAKSAKDLLQNRAVQERISALRQRAANRAELTFEGIISEIQEEARLARLAGQHSAALKAWEMLGGQLHRMFSKHVDVTHHTEFDGMSEDELREFIVNAMKDVGLDPAAVIEASAKDITPKGIAGPAGEGKAYTDTASK